MKFNKGLIRDRNQIDLPAGSWSDAKNIIISKADVISNEEGVTEYSDYPDVLKPVGKLLLGQKKILFSVNSFDSKSEIGYINNSGNYIRIISSSLLNFDINHPIQAEGQINYRGDEIIAWIDHNPPRIMNITNLPFELDVDLELIDSNRINAINVFQKSSPGVITVDSVNDTRGSILSGTVQFCIAYSNEGLSRTDLFNPTNIIPITLSRLPSGIQEYRGIEASTVTSKSISITISDLDTRFDYVHICVLRRNGGVLTLEEVSKVDINGSSIISYTYTGSENTIDLTLEDLLVARTPYNNAKAITQATDKLYLGNLTSDQILNWQEYFINIKVNYTTKEVRSGIFGNTFAHKDPKVIHVSQGFYPGEVYALYAAARLKSGVITPAFHIPGRYVAEISVGDLSEGNLESGMELLLDDAFFAEVLENAEITPDGALLDMGGVPNVSLGDFTNDYEAGARKYFQTRPTSNSSVAETNMGYWENSNEVYSNDSFWGPLIGQKVRHHRFPEAYEINNGNMFKSKSLKSLGITLSGFNTFPEEILNQIDSIEIFYARKDLNNSIILGQDITRFEVENYPGKEEYQTSSGGNWNTLQILSGDPKDTGRVIQTRLRSHTFDILKDKPSISPSYVTYQYGFQSDSLLKNYTDLDGTIVKREVIGNDDNGTERKTNLFLVLDYSDSLSTVDLVDGSFNTTVSFADYLQPVISSKYVPNNIVSGTEINTFGSEHFFMEIKGSPEIDIPTVILRYSSNATFRRIEFNGSVPYENVFVYNICQIRENLFVRFDNQTLISCGVNIKNFTVPFDVYNADTNISQYSFMETAKVPVFNDSIQPINEYYTLEDQNVSGIKVARRFFGYFRGNPSYRHISQGDPNSIFYNVENNTLLFDEFRRDLPESILYNDDYSFKNEVISVFPFSARTRETNRFPARIIRSVLQPREQVEIQWNRFLPGDYYEIQKNRGEIVNLESDNDRLMIHCRYGLFITRSSDTLSNNETDISVSSGDIFALPPREIISSDSGYAGLQSPFSAKKCKIGYVFADAEQGKIFIVNESLDEISSKGLRNYFVKELPLKISNQLNRNIDLPYSSVGIIIEFDERFNRLLVTKKDFTFNDFGDYSETPSEGLYSFNNGLPMRYVNSEFVIDPSGYTEDNFTMSYYPGYQIWVSFHDYIPELYFNDRKNLFSIKSGNIYIHNSNIRTIYGEEFISRIDYVFAEPQMLTKVLASVKWLSEVINGSLTEQRRTIDSITIYNSYQCSGEVILDDKNISYVENEWRFNKFMDIVKDRNVPFIIDNELDLTNINPNLPYYKQRKFIDKFFVVRVKYNNSLSKDIYIYDIDINVRQSAN